MACAVVFITVAMLLVAVVVPRLTGSTPYTILTGSMRPTLPPGTLVVVKPVDIADLSTGDVITYQLASGRSAVVTHRVVSVGSTLAGDRTVRTQGDANSAPDELAVKQVQVRGRVWYSLPLLGHVNARLSGEQRQTASIATGLALALYALSMFAGAARDRRRSRTRAVQGSVR